MRRSFIVFLIFCLICTFLTGCQHDQFTDQPENIPTDLPDRAMVDDSDFVGDYDAITADDINIPGRTHGRFNITPTLFVKLYNDSNPKHKIIRTVRSEKWNNDYVLSQCITDGPYTMYLRSNVELLYVYFSYPVAETQNGAWDYEEDIDKMIAVFDTAMPTLYEEDNPLSLKYLSKWIDVSSKAHNQEYSYLEILRKYMTMTFEIVDGTAYVGVGSAWFPTQNNWSTYF